MDMGTNNLLEIRDLLESDIALISDYWFTSSADHLLGMGVDLNCLPSREEMESFLYRQLDTEDQEKESLAMIATLKGEPIGHCNVNQITFGEEAHMHLHIWHESHRKMGVGAQMVLESIPVFFERLQLKRLWCEPYAENKAPNATLKKIGFKFKKNYFTIPGSFSFEQSVNQYELKKEDLEKLSTI
ncbi:hypothetical protein PEDI_07900 [Persicobacter diffluens]|uniref:N-acetyltransferase domain-containing protein n=2 Tax=Persicobacter diffluens TaxID=981 RepID=A0AAN5AKV0_9BACT|nr:hypothetical protein PEDI_07900 [Persicobacter diffluens]